MARWKILLEYDGTRFRGWQKQRHGRTVQAELEKALTTFCQQKINVMGQGRTDSGVHAAGQVAHADLPEQAPVERLLPAMRGLLPCDMAVINAEQVPENFHARFDATSRRYRYQIARRPLPLKRHLYWIHIQELEADILHKCASLIIGEHNFKNYSRQDVKEQNTVCRITTSQWDIDGDLYIYRIEGNRFLRHLVRRLVGTMQQAAIGKLSVDHFSHLLAARDVSKKGHAAPPEGLILEKVRY
ncbi:MAG: tRNA pseudouridine(38-40) synthase TruA [Balneolaceae bacterium]